MKGSLLKLFVCVVLVFGISGCGEKDPITDHKEMIKILKENGYERKCKIISKYENSCSFTGEKLSFLYTTDNMEISDKKRDRMYFETNVVFVYMDTGESAVCIFDKETGKLREEGSICSDKQLKKSKEFQQYYKEELKNMNIDEKELFKILKNDQKKFEKRRASFENNEYKTDPIEVIEKLGFIKDGDDYILRNFNDDLGDTTDIETLSFNFKYNEFNFYFSYDEDSISINWDLDLIARRNDDGEVCTYNISKQDWVELDCGTIEKGKLTNAHASFLNYILDNSIFIE